MTQSSPSNGADMAEELMRRRGELSDELARMTAPPEAGVNVSFGKRIGDGTTEAVERIATTATARSITASIDEIDQALRAIAEGTYGSCAVCRRPIPGPRLMARPATTRCVECAS